MGEVVSGPAERRLDYRVEGWDALKSVEVVRDNLPVHIEVPDYGAPRAAQPQSYRLRFEWGWGPMKGYQVYDWQGRLEVEGGRLLQVVPCFSSDPFDEVRRKRVLEWMRGSALGSLIPRGVLSLPRAMALQRQGPTTLCA